MRLKHDPLHVWTCSSHPRPPGSPRLPPFSLPSLPLPPLAPLAPLSFPPLKHFRLAPPSLPPSPRPYPSPSPSPGLPRPRLGCLALASPQHPPAVCGSVNPDPVRGADGGADEASRSTRSRPPRLRRPNRRLSRQSRLPGPGVKSLNSAATQTAACVSLFSSIVPLEQEASTMRHQGLVIGSSRTRGVRGLPPTPLLLPLPLPVPCCPVPRVLCPVSW